MYQTAANGRSTGPRFDRGQDVSKAILAAFCLEVFVTIDADLDMSPGTPETMNILPGVFVDFHAFTDLVALNGSPAEFTVVNDRESNTHRRYTLAFTDSAGQRQTVTSRYYYRLLWEAATLERQAWERKQKKRAASTYSETSDDDED